MQSPAKAKMLAYVAIEEIPEANWGMYGKEVDVFATCMTMTAAP
jgi:phenylpyruvate tautomerase PptA (4-oxalocrotonate tautomerase family)